MPAERAAWRDYAELTKPRVVALMCFTVLAGMLLARPAPVPWTVVVFGVAGIGLVAGAAAALNHLIDRHVDAVMARTRARPLPRGALSGRDVALFATATCVLGMSLLLVFTNPLCSWLSFASLVGYAGVYSLYLKRATPQNIVIGGAAGAMPPLLGWIAVTGQVEPGALLLFLIIFVWTPPHFWALAIHRREEYARVGIPMLPVTHGVAFTARRVLGYTLLLWGVTLLPAWIGMSGALYFAAALLLGLRFVVFAIALCRDTSAAMPTFRYSIAYLAALFAAMLIERFVPGGETLLSW
ncbi:heme o synthase [Schlegelella sp. S2-27]|uniref:Protoheme IX farnesyltransferase n=1 Tax=Caldimonas mangrovi TaxID=2944811 RepID=A0ABT0YH51_9BURK|nr:heme o synthase [Caldimonas mangrovi]MCM5678068.1 heme o synthase [Caldimonas mangrovi]